MKKNENGFSWIEAIVVVLIIAAVGLAGWYVKSKGDNKKTSDTKTSASQNAPADKEDTTAPSQQEEAKPDTSVVTFKEWNGVKLKIPASLKTMTYTFSTEGGIEAARLSSAELATAAGSTKNCKGESLLGALSRSKDSTVHMSTIGVGHIGEYYYFYSGAQVGCFPEEYNPAGDSTPYPSSELQKKAIKQIEDSFPGSLTE